MTEDKLIELIKQKNPQLGNETITMRADGFIKAMRLAYTKGYEQGHDNARNYKTDTYDLPDFMKGFFGK